MMLHVMLCGILITDASDVSLGNKKKQLNKLANCQLQPAASIAAFVDLFRDRTDQVRPIGFRRLIQNSAKM